MKKTGILVVLVLAIAFVSGCYNTGYDLNETEFEEFEEFEDVADGDLEKVGEDLVKEEKTADEVLGGMREEVKEEAEVLEKVEEETKTEVLEKVEEETKTEEETTQKMQGDSIVVTEGDLVEVTLKGTDPDGDPITYTFGPPLGTDGKWQTELGDEGTYDAEITASDGKTSVTKSVKVVVEHRNRAPVLQEMANVVVDEGQTVTLNPVVSDVENDKVELTFTGWMTSPEYDTTYDDAGEYLVTITATDGELSNSIDVTVIVNDVNRAPEFEIVLG